MTLQTYSVERMDELAMRMFDVAATLRQTALLCRENDMEGFPLHDKKALEWIAQLEQWAHEGVGKVQASVVSQKAVQRALQAASGGKKKK
ncbi:MAG: hypothetical protein AB7O62_10610 [Pirellulales bacterium]